MSDLVARLPEGANDLSYEYSPGTVALIREAITEIERLRAVLKDIADHDLEVGASTAARWALQDTP